MALKRLDEEFELKPGTQLLPYMKRLLPSLEGRFQAIESDQDIVAQLTEEIRAAALMRMNEILIPATEDIIKVTKLGFLLGPVSTTYTLIMGYMTMIIDEGPQRNSFTPSPYVIVEHSPDDYAIARVGSYTQSDGLIELYITAIHGNPGPHSTWMISSTPGMADSTKLYHDAIAPMHTEVASDYTEIVTMHQEILEAYQDLAESGLDLTAYVRKDGTRAFTAVQLGVHPAVGSNDQTLTTTAWSRARMQEYTANAVSRAGDTMAGPLTLPGAPSQPLHAVTKQYVDAVLGQGGVMNANLTIRASNPTLYLRPTATAENRMLESQSIDGLRRWIIILANAEPETGGNTGANFALYRYSDTGVMIDQPIHVNRQTGRTTLGALTTNGGMNVTGGDLTLAGDMHIYRPGAPTSSVIYCNQANSAYWHFDGTNHQFQGGGVTMPGAVSTGPLTVNGGFTTNGNYATVWGLTSHGAVTVNGAQTINGDLQLNGPANYIRFYDNDWGMMYLHHQNQNIGFLNNGGGWIWYVNNDGHYWSPQYGWLHDYVNNTAYNQAVAQANAVAGSKVSNGRWVHAGDTTSAGHGAYTEIASAALTSYMCLHNAGYPIPAAFRHRYMQLLTTSWFTIGYAS